MVKSVPRQFLERPPVNAHPEVCCGGAAFLLSWMLSCLVHNSTKASTRIDFRYVKGRVGEGGGGVARTLQVILPRKMRF